MIVGIKNMITVIIFIKDGLSKAESEGLRKTVDNRNLNL